jgi:hypothetical protein
VGAGDSFDAGFIHQFIRRAKVEDSLKFGNVAGALSVTRAGGTEAFRDARHREEFIRKTHRGSGFRKGPYQPVLDRQAYGFCGTAVASRSR